MPISQTLFNQEPSELLDLFKKLESENLSLIQDCQQVKILFLLLDCEALALLEAGRALSVGTRSELNHQTENLETEIRQLEARIAEEKKEAAKVEEIIENSGRNKYQ